MIERRLPPPDIDGKRWWATLCEHRLQLQRCQDCARYRWPPSALCGRCGSMAWDWADASGEGIVASWTVTHHAFGSGANEPYTVVLVQLAEQDDVFMPGDFDGPLHDPALQIGAMVEVGFQEVRDGDRTGTILSWRLR